VTISPPVEFHTDVTQLFHSSLTLPHPWNVDAQPVQRGVINGSALDGKMDQISTKIHTSKASPRRWRSSTKSWIWPWRFAGGRISRRWIPGFLCQGLIESPAQGTQNPLHAKRADSIPAPGHQGPSAMSTVLAEVQPGDW